MTNGYFDSGDYTPLARNTLARSNAVNAIVDAIIVGFDLLPTPTEIRQGLANYAITGGSANAYTFANAVALTSLSDGIEVKATIHAANTGASTINVDGLGAVTIKRPNGDALSSGDLPIYAPVTLRYVASQSQFRLVSTPYADVTAAAASASSASSSASAASASADAASDAQAAAEAAQTAAETVYDNFDDRYLGAKGSEPSVDNDGNALTAGALFFDTANVVMKAWSGSAWVEIGASASGVQSVNASGGTTGLSFSGGPVTTTGTLTLAGTLAVANGGTGSTSAANARTALGVAIGTDVQAYNANLAALATLTNAADKGFYFTGGGNMSTFDFTSAGRALLDDANNTAQRATLGLTIGTHVQAYHANLDLVAGLTGATNRGFYFDSASTMGTYTITAAGRALLDDADASAQRTTLGLGAAALEALPLAVGSGGTGATTASGARTALELGALAVLSTVDNSVWSGAPLATSNGGTGATTISTARSNLGLGSSATVNTGTSGSVIPLLSGNNTWGGTQALPVGSTYNSLRIAHVASGSASATGKISWGTAAPGTLAEGEIYFRYAA